MIRNHPELVAVIAILLTLPFAYVLGGATRKAHAAAAPVRQEIRSDIQRERARIQRQLRRKVEMLRLERRRLRDDLRDGLRHAFRFRTA